MNKKMIDIDIDCSLENIQDKKNCQNPLHIEQN